MEEVRQKQERDHTLLRELVRALSDGLAAQDLAAAGQSLDHLAQSFRRCVREEEDKILPLLEQLTGVGALTRAAAARSEHRVLLDLLSSVERAVSRGDLAVAAIDLRELVVTLELHLRKERMIVDLLVEQLGRSSHTAA